MTETRTPIRYGSADLRRILFGLAPLLTLLALLALAVILRS
jgi:hypothetical protein